MMDSMVRAYGRSGGHLNGLDDDGLPIAYALLFRNVGAARALAACGARVDNVAVAAGLGRVDLLQDMVSKTRPPVALKGTIPVMYGQHPDATRAVELALVFAATAGELEAAALLLNRGVDPNAWFLHRLTPLHEAAWGSHLEVVKLLVKSGARTDIVDKQFDTTPVGWAAHGGHQEVVEYLSKHASPKDSE